MNKKDVDVICTHYRDGTIQPNRIRIQDEDGQYQVFAKKNTGIYPIKGPKSCRTGFT